MADIDIEKKSSGNKWIWIILGIIILALLIWWLTGNFAGDNDEEIEDTTIEQVEETSALENEENDGVARYLSYIEDKSRMGIDHEYTNNALIELMSAVESKAREKNVNIDAEMQEIRLQTQELTQNPAATDHADIIKNSGEKIVDALKTIQEESYPNLSSEIEDVRNALQEIQPTVQTLEQKDQVNSFFDEAADVLRKMS